MRRARHHTCAEIDAAMSAAIRTAEGADSGLVHRLGCRLYASNYAGRYAVQCVGPGVDVLLMGTDDGARMRLTRASSESTTQMLLWSSLAPDAAAFLYVLWTAMWVIWTDSVVRAASECGLTAGAEAEDGCVVIVPLPESAAISFRLLGGRPNWSDVSEVVFCDGVWRYSRWLRIGDRYYGINADHDDMSPFEIIKAQIKAFLHGIDLLGALSDRVRPRMTTDFIPELARG